MSKFVHMAEEDTTTGQAPQIQGDHVQPGGQVTILLSYEQAVAILPILETMVDYLVATVGRG
jgi:hypothetical protein